MFVHAYFPVDYFPEDYFPGGTVASDPSYFHHAYFPIDYFPNDYFPGDLVAVVVPPPEPEPEHVFVGSRGFPRRLAPVLHARAHIKLRGVLDVSALAFLAPVQLHADFEAHLQAILELRDRGQTIPANLAGQWAGAFQFGIYFSADGTVNVPKPRAGQSVSRRDLDEEEQLLLEHYLLSLKGEA